MRIAQVAPLFESVPPRLYGGTERIVFNLTEAFTRSGHEVTLFASGDSVTSAELVSCCNEGLRLSKCREPLAPHIVQFELLREQADQFDIIHFHTEIMHLALAQSLDRPCLFTFHGRLDFPEYRELFRRFPLLPLTSISLNQRKPLPEANWVGNIYHGLDVGRFEFHPEDGEYLAFLGRISPEKGFEHAVEIARRSGLKLKVAAKIDVLDREYHLAVGHLLDEPFVEYVGEITDREKSDFLGNAKALLFPIQWPEPFGLVMIESMATGTPVIAFGSGSVPEVVDNGLTGFVVNDVESAVEAVMNVHRLSRHHCRLEFEARFARERMSRDYLKIYDQIITQYDLDTNETTYTQSAGVLIPEVFRKVGVANSLS